MASGDRVVASSGFAAELLGVDRKLLALEMEAAGVARACHAQGRDWLVIRGISDSADGHKRQLDGTAGGGYQKLAARSAAEYLRWWLHWLAKEKRIEHCLGGSPRSTGRTRAPDLEEGVLPEPAKFGDVPSYPPNFRRSLEKSFVGREEDAWRIHKALQGTSGVPASVLLHAAGGFGKTRLALEYMHRFGPRCYPGGLFWVDAAVGPELLEEQFHGILRRLDESFPDLLECRRLGLNIRVRLSEALEKAAKKNPVLYIVDNVPESTETAGPRLPLETWCPATSKVSLIATSRERWVKDVHLVAVSALSPEAAEAMLAAGLSPAVRERLDKGGALELTQWVGFHPLALEILNGALRHWYSPEDLLAMARRQRPTKGVEQYFKKIQGRELDLKRGVLETFELSYARLSKLQQRLAQLLAQLAAEPVPRLLARKLAPTPLTDDALTVLVDRHFVTPVEEVGGVEMYGEMHRLLADYLRYRGDKPRQELRQACGTVDSAVSEQAELADRVQVEPSTIVRIVDRMERDGWIERASSPTDRRVKLLRTTDKIKPVWKTIQQVGDQIIRQTTEGLSERQVAQMLKSLETMCGNLGGDA
jgi:DNA-binding MarR family transcriptional regulator